MLDPKEYATQLIEKYNVAGQENITYGMAKSFALICVNEILKAVTAIADKKYDFYNQVKEHIKQL